MLFSKKTTLPYAIKTSPYRFSNVTVIEKNNNNIYYMQSESKHAIPNFKSL